MSAAVQARDTRGAPSTGLDASMGGTSLPKPAAGKVGDLVCIRRLADAHLAVPVAPLSDVGMGTAYQVGDMSYAMRVLPDVASSLPSPNMCPGLNVLTHPNVVSFYQTQGVTTGLNVFWGALSLFPSINALARAQRYGDKDGEIAAITAIARKTTMALGGLFYLMFRPLAVAAALKNVPSASFTGPSLLGNAAFATGMIGTGMFMGFYALLTYESYLGFHGSDVFLKKLESAEDKLWFFKEELSLTEEEQTQIDGYTQEELAAARKKEVERGAQDLLTLFKESGRKDVPQTLEECRSCFEALLVSSFPKGGGAEAAFLRDRAREDLLIKKEMMLTNVLGPALTARVKALVSSSSNETVDVVVADIRTSLSTNSKLCKTEFVIYLVGAIACILFFATLTGGWGAVVAAVLFVLIAVGMLCTDGFRLYQAVQSGEVAKHDPYVVISLMAVLTAVTVLAFCIACLFFPPTLVPILIIALTYLSTMALNGVMLHYIYKVQANPEYKKNLETQEQAAQARKAALAYFCDGFSKK